MLFPLKREEMVWESDGGEALTSCPARATWGPGRCVSTMMGPREEFLPSSCSLKLPTHQKCLSINLLNTKD